VMCASLALAVLLNCTSDSRVAGRVASDTIPDASGPIWAPALSPVVQPGRWDPTRFDSATAVGVKGWLDSATVHGLPYGPLYSNALMGSAMRASGKEIVNRTRLFFIALIDSRAALGERSTDSELATGAELLRAGMDGKALQSIREVRPTVGSALTALVVAADFVKRGIPTNQARDAVTALGRVSRSDEGLNAAQALVARNAERGPGMARDALDRYVKSYVGGAQKNAPGKQVVRPPGPPDES